MPVNGQELATLDFGNLIGGPLSAVVEAQAKSSMRTADFIREVAFDKDGKIVNVDFTYNRKDDNGNDQEFTLTVPFLTMVPVPYIQIDEAIIEFNAKITSVTQQGTVSQLANRTDAAVGGSWWFARAALTTKTAYQRTSASSDKEERTFDMRVYVKARGTDMPSGTERLLTILENVISERKGGGGAQRLKPTTTVTLDSSGNGRSKEVTFDSPITADKIGWGLIEGSGGATKAWITKIGADGKVTLLNAGNSAFEIKPEGIYSIKAVAEVPNIKVTTNLDPFPNTTPTDVEFDSAVIAARDGWKLRETGSADVLATVVTAATGENPKKLGLKAAATGKTLDTTKAYNLRPA